MKEFILAVEEETIDKDNGFGDITSECYLTKLVCKSENNDIFLELHEGKAQDFNTQDQDITELYNFSKTDFNIKEVERFLEYLKG